MGNASLRVVAALAASAVLALTAASAHALSTRDLTRCQASLQREAARLTKTRAALLDRCVGVLLECRLRSEVDAQPLAPCESVAVAACAGQLAAAADAEAAFDGRVARRCGIPDSDMRSRRGLGFRDDADVCAALTPPATVTTTADALACARRAAACGADDQVEQETPRTYELLSAVGLAGSAPCVDVRAPALAGAGSTASATLLGCQGAIAKESLKLSRARERSIRMCEDRLLRCDLATDRLERTLAQRAECRAKAASRCASVTAGLARQEANRDARILGRCGSLSVADVKNRLGFGLTCASATTVADISTCLGDDLATRRERLVGTITPRTCALLRAAGQLAGYEDTCVPSCGNGIVEGSEQCDDGNADPTDQCTTSCTPGLTDVETIVIPSTAAPANTPDGTPANAVPTGGTLATQFGSTVFSLNHATYTRHFVPGAGDPDAVLILIPGFAAGAGTFKNLAENLLVRAEAAAQIRLEVWAFDRRTNQLEDVAGAEIAEADLDAQLALDWFFGAEVGLALDPRLSRRAVFHSGSDVAFMANFTPHVFARDIDAVVEAARALPSSPRVFLGGHSLGTTFTARYAATDFDPGAPVVPGFAKVAGLVLLEGGGGSILSTPPTSDDLDKVIAKADGGLYHAVKDAAPRCVDGTPCMIDGDCAAVALPPGALSNKCVAPVDAYTGATVTGVTFITPQIQAAGDTVGIQGVLDPAGLAVIHQDFGNGGADETVPGLGILNSLPPASAEAGVGFFLDDDFSPVSAFRASLGYSNNGPNVSPFPGFLLPLAATSDPYRLWIHIDEPQPPQAIPNNGPPSANLSQVWGQEKEVTNLSRFFPSLFAGGTDFGDWYFPAAGLSATSELNGSNTFGGLDSTPLSVGRGRPDIENLTQAAAVNIPVICFGASNGLTPTAASYRAFANSIGTCTAPTCNGTTPRLVADSPITPTYGGINGGFEVYINEGYAHVDVVTAEDDPSHNNVVAPLLAFLTRNTP